MRERIEISQSWSLKIEAFRAHVGFQTSKNEIPEGNEKQRKKENTWMNKKRKECLRWSRQIWR